MACLVTQTFYVDSFAFRLATAPRAFTPLSTPILFLCKCRGFHVDIYLGNVQVLTHAKQADKRAWILLLSFGSSWITFVLQFWTSSHFALSIFRIVLGYSEHVIVFVIWQFSWDIQVGSFFVTEATCYSPSVFFSFMGRTTYCTSGYAHLCQLCCGIQSDLLNVYNYPAHVFFLSPFSFSMVTSSETISVVT